MNTIAYMALVGSISAIQLTREPLLTWSATPPATHPINYPVPDFGVAHEMVYTENNRKIAEAEGGEIPMDATSPWPHTDTTVEFKLLQTDAEINREPLLSANASPLEVQQRPAYAGYPVDYFVPDFGKSHEIIYTENNIKNTEVQMAHNLKADFGANKPTVGTPRDYVVPDFGVDEDIIGVTEGIQWAQDNLSHVWTPTQDANGYWTVPEAASNDSYSYDGNSGFTNHLAGAVYSGTN